MWLTCHWKLLVILQLKIKRKIKYYICDSRNDLVARLNELIVRQSRILVGKEFHTSGPLCLIDLWAKVVRGFVKWKFDACLVEYEWTALFDRNIEEKVMGSKFVFKRYMNKAL